MKKFIIFNSKTIFIEYGYKFNKHESLSSQLRKGFVFHKYFLIAILILLRNKVIDII